jgi:hypothetical protein
MTTKRLPSFNDFSPEILRGDLRPCLKAVVDGGGDDEKVIKSWAGLYFKGVLNKRSSTNIPATLRSTGLSTGERPIRLSDVGIKVLQAASALEAAQVFCKHLVDNKNGDLLIGALLSLNAKGTKVGKESLKSELRANGITSLSTNTTDHSTLKNWMIAAGLVSGDGKPIDSALKSVLGISATESDELRSLPLAQQVFLEHLRRKHLTSDGPFLGQDLFALCRRTHHELFNEGQFARQVREPLRIGGWIEVEGLAPGAHGGKTGKIVGTKKLLDIPPERVVPDFESAIPPDLRGKLKLPLSEIQTDLRGEDTYRGGLALELLSLRMVLDLDLEPRNFRLRSSQTAHAEVDLIAEGAHLMFSRWTIQCKRNLKNVKVDLGDVAKEVGIAVFAKAHVVVVVTTSDFTEAAYKYAEEVTKSLPLQFLFVPGKVVDRYLKQGPSVLIEHVRDNARSVMRIKRSQELPGKTLGSR